MKKRVKRSGAQVDFETIPNLEVDLVAPARLALEEPENNEVEMILHQSLSPGLIQIFIQAAPRLLPTKPNNCPLTLSRFLSNGQGPACPVVFDGLRSSAETLSGSCKGKRIQKTNRSPGKGDSSDPRREKRPSDI